MIPSSKKYLIIGAGMHGLSTAYHLALELKNRGLGSGKDILVIDKSGIGAGASGIACGVVRNNYFQPAMRELMAQSVEVWESDPKSYSYHPVGYMQISPEVMHSDVASIYEQQNAIGYPSEFVEGSEDSMAYMQGIFNDWQAKGITSVLHEKKGGYSNNMKCMQGLAAKAESEEVTIMGNVEVTGVQFSGSSVSAVETNRGTIQTDYVVVEQDLGSTPSGRCLTYLRKSMSGMVTTFTKAFRCGVITAFRKEHLVWTQRCSQLTKEKCRRWFMLIPTPHYIRT